MAIKNFDKFNQQGEKYKKEMDENPDALKVSFDVLPNGRYEVTLDSAELKDPFEGKAEEGTKLVADFKFKVIKGDNKGKTINPSFWVYGGKTKDGATVDKNGLSLDLRKIHDCLEFMRSLKPSFGPQLAWEGRYDYLSQDILDLFQESSTNKVEYEIEITRNSYNGKEYPNYKITQKF